MGIRGRHSSTSLSVVGGVEIIPRPSPAEGLTQEQAAEWTAIVNRMPADWFPRETHPLLAQYCRHTTAARRIAELIRQEEDSEEFDLDRYERLLRMQAREARVLGDLATRLRISQQSGQDYRKPRGKLAKTPFD